MTADGVRACQEVLPAGRSDEAVPQLWSSSLICLVKPVLSGLSIHSKQHFEILIHSEIPGTNGRHCQDTLGSEVLRLAMIEPGTSHANIQFLDVQKSWQFDLWPR